LSNARQRGPLAPKLPLDNVVHGAQVLQLLLASANCAGPRWGRCTANSKQPKTGQAPGRKLAPVKMCAGQIGTEIVVRMSKRVRGAHAPSGRAATLLCARFRTTSRCSRDTSAGTARSLLREASMTCGDAIRKNSVGGQRAVRGADAVRTDAVVPETAARVAGGGTNTRENVAETRRHT
jgi:hypothetical protein